jgi:hypothetical protein
MLPNSVHAGHFADWRGIECYDPIGGTMNNLTKQEMAEHLYLTAVTTAAGHGRAFRKIAEGELRQQIDQAASEILSPSRFGATSAQYANETVEKRLVEADAATHKLVLGMISHAQTVPSYPANVLGERTLSAALSSSSFCPCWPFC